MKNLYSCIFLLFAVNASAQIVTIPDAAFKAKLLEADNTIHIAQDAAGQNIRIDLNQDGEIQASEALLVYSLSVDNAGIQSLTGIESFTNLRQLYCSSNLLVSLDISQNADLEILNCSHNQLVQLDVSNQPDLHYLDCSYNLVTSLDVSSNLSLSTLICHVNQLATLDVVNNVNLVSLTCRNNLLTELELGNHPYLNGLSCDTNQLTSLYLDGCDSLYSLNCTSNQLESIDAGNNPLLGILSSSGNDPLTFLNIKNGNTNYFPALYLNNPNLQFICAEPVFLGEIQQIVNSMELTNCHVGIYCNFTPGGTFYSIQGTARMDVNEDGCDVADIDYPNLNLSISDGTVSGTFIASQSGSYSVPVQEGQYTLVPHTENPGYFNVSPSVVTIDFPADASPFVQDFCITPNGNHSDVEIVFSPIISARPGFEASYRLLYRNKGNQVEDGTVSLAFDETVLEFISATESIDNQSGNIFSWNYTGLNPFESRNIDVVFNVNGPMDVPAIEIDDILNFNAVISTGNTDETPDDNVFELNQVVVGAYDPNDKTCLQGEIVGPDRVGAYVHYLIRFENTGNYPAEHIVVKDEIDEAKFDITSLIPLDGSHSFYTKINGNQVEFIFENIQLDFNDDANDGYVLFKIKTKSSLAVGQSFSNYADIYFDYNFPVTTNTYVTHIQVLGLEEPGFESGLLLYPNPAVDYLTIRSQNDALIRSVEVHSVSGQQILTSEQPVIETSSLEKGAYIVKVITDKGIGSSMFVKR